MLKKMNYKSVYNDKCKKTKKITTKKITLL